MTYETLDTIADAYTPIIALCCLGIILLSLQHNRKRCWLLGAALLCGLVVAYGLMAIDQQCSLWPRWGLDYSTHTAVSLVLVIFLVVTTKHPWGLISIGSLSAYFLLMLYQKYHTVEDILTTAVVVSLVFIPIITRLLSEQKRSGN